MKITAVIPVRQGSQRVKNKCLRPFGDTSLLELKISVLKQIPHLNDIVVNTDSDDALAVAKKCGVSGHKREAYYASSQCISSDFQHHLGQVTDTDLFVYCPVTSPFITKESIIECIDLFNSMGDGYDSVATVTRVKEFMWLNNEPINYTREKQPNSQDLPEIKALSFGVNIIKRDDLIKYRNFVGLKPYFFETDEIQSIDIDTPLDFFIAQSVYQRMVIEKAPLL